MKYLIFLNLFLANYLAALSQSNFDEIKVCHAIDHKIKQVFAGGYIVNFENGKMTSFRSSDNIIQYQEPIKLIGISLNEDTTFSLQLTKDGIYYKNKDTNFVINTAMSVGLRPFDSVGKLYAFIHIKKYSIVCVFERNMINRIFFDMRGKHFSIIVYKTSKGFIWDFGISGNKSENWVTITYAYDYPYLFSITDMINTAGISMHYSKKVGNILKIQGFKVDKNGNTFGDPAMMQSYSKKGILRKGRKAFNSLCD